MTDSFFHILEAVHTTMNPNEQQPLTFDELLARCMGELEFAQKILQDFFASSESLLDDIESCIETDSMEDAARKVHRLKGTAATVAAKPLFQSLVDIEDFLKGLDGQGDSPEPSNVSDELNQKLQTSRLRFDQARQFAECQLL